MCHGPRSEYVPRTPLRTYATGLSGVSRTGLRSEGGGGGGGGGGGRGGGGGDVGGGGGGGQLNKNLDTPQGVAYTCIDALS